jgi:8-oxo-dGTP pyrophosphatase MutT (NUDIX family)
MDLPALDPALFPVPPALVARARRLDAGELVPVRPRQASTVVLLRDAGGEAGTGEARTGDAATGEAATGEAATGEAATGDAAAGVEAYVLRRRTTMAFAAGMYVFPGGTVDARDGEATLGWAGPPAAAWANRLGFDNDAEARASVCAGVRELFEETGVLLAGPTADSLVDDPTAPDWERDRLALLGREVSFAEVLVRRDLVLRSDLLAACAHWVTPEAEERRYDTRFYLAALPSGQRSRDVSGEADRVAWIRPAEAAAALQAGEMRMLPPTAATLAALEGWTSVREAMAAAQSWPIRRIMPAVDVAGDGRWVLPE